MRYLIRLRPNRYRVGRLFDVTDMTTTTAPAPRLYSRPLELPTAIENPLSPPGFVALVRAGWKELGERGFQFRLSQFPCPVTPIEMSYEGDSKVITGGDVCAVAYNLVLKALEDDLVEDLRQIADSNVRDRHSSRASLPGNVWRNLQSYLGSRWPSEIDEIVRLPNKDEDGTHLRCAQVGWRAAELVTVAFKSGVVDRMTKAVEDESNGIPPRVSNVSGFVKACLDD
jgi:hypothetical protein